MCGARIGVFRMAGSLLATLSFVLSGHAAPVPSKLTRENYVLCSPMFTEPKISIEESIANCTAIIEESDDPHDVAVTYARRGKLYFDKGDSAR